MRFVYSFLLCAALLPLAGCGKSKGAAAATPDGAAKMIFVDSIVEYKPEGAWDSLPDSYQKDVTDLTHKFGEKVDPQIYDGVMNTVRKAVKVAKSKREFIVNSDELKQSGVVKAESIAPTFDAVVLVLDKLSNSEIGTTEKLKKADVRAFLDDTIGDIAEQSSKIAQSVNHPSAAQLSDIQATASKAKITVVKEEGDKATLKIETSVKLPDGKEETKVEDQEFVKVEGKWIPAELAKGWKENIATLNTSIDRLPDLATTQKPKILAILAFADGYLDNLDKAKSKEEFTATLFGDAAALPALLGAGGNQLNQPGDEFNPPEGFDKEPVEAPEGFGVPPATDKEESGDAPKSKPTTSKDDEEMEEDAEKETAEGEAGDLDSEVEKDEEKVSEEDKIGDEKADDLRDENGAGAVEEPAEATP